MDEDRSSELSSEQITQIVEKATEPKHWDYTQFRRAMNVVTAAGRRVPAHNRPDSIHIQGLRSQMRELNERTAQTGKEHARVIFTKPEKGLFVWSNKTTVGTEGEVTPDWSLPPEMHRKLRKAFVDHTHPLPKSNQKMMPAAGFSGADYKYLMADPKQQGMFMHWGDADFFVLKTGATRDMSADAVERIINDNEEDMNAGINRKNYLQRAVQFNKDTCMELGLVLYMASAENRDLMERVAVTL